MIDAIRVIETTFEGTRLILRVSENIMLPQRECSVKILFKGISLIFTFIDQKDKDLSDFGWRAIISNEKKTIEFKFYGWNNGAEIGMNGFNPIEIGDIKYYLKVLSLANLDSNERKFQLFIWQPI